MFNYASSLVQNVFPISVDKWSYYDTRIYWKTWHSYLDLFVKICSAFLKAIFHTWENGVVIFGWCNPSYDCWSPGLFACV